MYQGKLVVFEGPDNTGKSSLLEAVSTQRPDVRALRLAYPGNEPGTLGNLVYRLHHEPNVYGLTHIAPLSLQTLHIAAHIDTIERQIIPALRSGVWVFLDRYWWSTLVYGSIAKVERNALNLLIRLEQKQWRGISPDIVFLITRRVSLAPDDPRPRFERLSDLYRRLARRESRRYPVAVIENHNFSDSVHEIGLRLNALEAPVPPLS